MASLKADVLVIGGGATGVCVAWDAALRGFDVMLVERGDLAEGTSGRFHGLLHSGGRYVVKDPLAAEECVAENPILRRIIPDSIEDTGGLFVTTPDDDPAYADRFLEGCHKAKLPVEELDVAEALAREPRLNPAIRRAFTVPDAAIDIWKSVWAFAGGAAAHGARILTYHKVVGIHRADGAVTGARLHKVHTGEEFDVETGFILNASGPWAAQILHMAGIEDVGVVPGKGIMIAMNHRLVNTVVNRCVMPADGDILVPIRTVSVIGTTDSRVADPDELPVTQEEVDADARRRRAAGAGLPRGARAARLGGRAPAVPGRQGGRRERHPRRQPHPRGGRPPRARRRRRAADDVGRQADDDAADGAGHRGRHVRPDERRASVPHGRGRAAGPGPGRGDLPPRRPPAPPRGDAARRAADLRMRADRPRPPRGGDAPARDDEPRRHPPPAAPGHGPVPGRLLHLPGGRHHARHRPARRRAGGRSLTDFLQERWKGIWPILYGDQLRQMRLDDWIFQGVLDVEHLPAGSGDGDGEAGGPDLDAFPVPVPHADAAP